MNTEYNNDLFWHALNYRTAATEYAEEMWQELNSCVNRLVEAERERCASVSGPKCAEAILEAAGMACCDNNE